MPLFTLPNPACFTPEEWDEWIRTHPNRREDGQPIYGSSLNC